MNIEKNNTIDSTMNFKQIKYREVVGCCKTMKPTYCEDSLQKQHKHSVFHFLILFWMHVKELESFIFRARFLSYFVYIFRGEIRFQYHILLSVGFQHVIHHSFLNYMVLFCCFWKWSLNIVRDGYEGIYKF